MPRQVWGDAAVRRLVRATFWTNLVGLDLRGNLITDAGGRHLLRAPIPPDLTALWLNEDRIGPDLRVALRQRFGGRVLFDTASGEVS